MAASVAFPLVPPQDTGPGGIARNAPPDSVPPPALGAGSAGVGAANADAFSAALARRSQPETRGAGSNGAVAAQRTPLSADEAGTALSSAWQATFGEPANSQTLSVLVGHWAHETGSGRAMMNYNFGGLKGHAAGGSASYRTTEGSGASRVHTVAAFRAYDGAAAGAADYVKLLRDRYPAALDAARAGDPTGFVHALKQGGYFTDNETSYARSVSRLAGQLGSQGIDTPRGIDGARGDGVVSGGALAAVGRNGRAAVSPGQALGLGAGPAVAMRPVDVQSFSDAITQAALRILATGPGEQSES
jgi:hypothetical protein